MRIKKRSKLISILKKNIKWFRIPDESGSGRILSSNGALVTWKWKSIASQDS